MKSNRSIAAIAAFTGLVVSSLACGFSKTAVPVTPQGITFAATPEENKPADKNTSPAYTIFVGAYVHGKCGFDSNSGGIEKMTVESWFEDIHFQAPSDTGLPGPVGGIYQGHSIPVGVPGVGLIGKGDVGPDFSLCPMYETETDSYASRVTDGPHPFEPSLSLMPSSADEMCVVDLVGTQPKLTGGGSVYLVYSIGSTADMGPILLWDGKIGIGALGGSIEPVQGHFCFYWEQLLSGQEFQMTTTSGDESEQWDWTIQLSPAK
jgi:hypothetical protein